MKNLIIALLISIASPLTFAEELVLLNWEEYTPESILEKFKLKTGHTVRVITYDSMDEVDEMLNNEAKFDLLVLSNQIIHKYAPKILPLNHQLIPNFSLLSTDFIDPPYDIGNKLSAPYQWGTTGIGYNTAKFDAPVTSWNSLFGHTQDHDVHVLGDAREVIGAALKSLGYSINSENQDEIIEAKKVLLAAKEKGLKIVGAVEAQGMLINETTTIAHGYSGDMISATDENEHIEYVIPEEGCTFWVDTIVISKNTIFPKIAHEFINFTLEPEIAAEITNENWYASPVAVAEKYVATEIKQNPAIYPTKDTWKKMEFIRKLPDHVQALYDAAWAEITR